MYGVLSTELETTNICRWRNRNEIASNRACTPSDRAMYKFGS